MSNSTLETYIRQYLGIHRLPEVSICWQGGEPTLMGVDFYRRAIKYQRKYKQPGTTIHNIMQTNGVLLTDEWCDFFRKHNFLIGLSIDGPEALHDAYRVDKSGRPTFKRVLRGLKLLQKHRVEINVLSTVHAANGDHPLEVYRFLRDEADVRFIQFIPIVERDNETGFQEGNSVTNRSIKAEQYGKFLINIFDEWVGKDVGKVFVQLFDVALEAWVGATPNLCAFSPTCGNTLVLEHNGDLYTCDHFVEPKYLLGNIKKTHMADLTNSEKQRRFGQDKIDSLSQFCRECRIRFVCHGGCPKNRFITPPGGEPGLNYLCSGYRAFFDHIDEPMRIMAGLLKQNRPPAEIMQILEKNLSHQN